MIIYYNLFNDFPIESLGLTNQIYMWPPLAFFSEVIFVFHHMSNEKPRRSIQEKKKKTQGIHT